MNAELELDQPYEASQPAIWMMMIASLCWVGIHEAPAIPIGFLMTLYLIGRSYETTVTASWRRGWRIIAGSAAVSAVSWLTASLSLNFGAESGSFSLGFLVQIARWVDWVS